MAVILVLACGFVGFSSALVSLLFFEATLAQALGLWVGVGFTIPLIVLLVTLFPRRPPAEDRHTEIA